MENFWDYNVWGFINLVVVLLLSMLAANFLKKVIKPLAATLIPTSVLGGCILLLFATVYKAITGNEFFDTNFFAGNGSASLEIITYHALALGFIASTFKGSKGKMTKKRTEEIFNTGVTTVSTYLLQAVFGFGITLLFAYFTKDFFQAAGLLLPFGYGQGTGQALNYGGIYETQFGFVGGKSFGLTVAAMGFLCASIGGVIHLNIIKKRDPRVKERIEQSKLAAKQQSIENEQEGHGADKMTIQIALVMSAYFLAYLLMLLLSTLLPGMKSVIFGFNFLLGVLAAVIIKTVMNFLYRKDILHHQHINDYLMTRVSNFFYDIMVVAGVAAIRLGNVKQYWLVLLILGVCGLLITYIYNRIVAVKLFPEYKEEQFAVMYGMLTGTASTGVILLRELDANFSTPAADNLVYQNFPAIVFGFPMMLLVTLAPVKPYLTFGILCAFFVVMNIILFRKSIFKKRKASKQ